MQDEKKRPGVFYLLGLGLLDFSFYLAVLAAFRLIFIWRLADYMGPDVAGSDIAAALGQGLKLSCRTAGVMTALSWLVPSVIDIVRPGWGRKPERALRFFVLSATSCLFVASFPYYRQFHANFHQLLFNTFNDDIYALLVSLTVDYYLPLRLAWAFLLAALLWRWQGKWRGLVAPDFCAALSRPVSGGINLLIALAFYAMVQASVWGGNLTWQRALDWENAGITGDDFLNEAILDSWQAVYRAYVMNHRLLACDGMEFTPRRLRELGAMLARRQPDSDNPDDYLRRRAGGAKITRPRHIFIILSESYANWPLLEKYKSLHLADGMRGLLSEADSAGCGKFLPNGASTVAAVTGLVTGLADANLYLTVMPRAYEGAYSTAFAPQLKKLGYATEFWYAGPTTWERIGAFTKAQGFDEFYGRDDLGDAPGSVWGCEDEYLYGKILAAPLTKPTVRVILNASNHSPYNVDVKAKGFDAEKLRRALPPESAADDDLINTLGHYWYADRELAKFVRAAREKYPDSLFIVTGDHADRCNIEKTPPLYERYAVPFVIIGGGIGRSTIHSSAAGSHIDILPTIMELIAPAGWEYFALGRSLTMPGGRGVSEGVWIDSHFIGRTYTADLSPESYDGTDLSRFDKTAAAEYIDAVRGLSWWRGTK